MALENPASADSSSGVTVRIQHEDFDVSAEIACLRAGKPQIGAVATFIGVARDCNEGATVTGLVLEHYPGMTERALQEIGAQARQRWGVIDVLIVHRIGELQPLDQIVLVAVTGAHRGEAFAACEFVMDYLKTDAPFWKREVTSQGARWVEARATDEDARARWAGDADVNDQ
jgi:molybdopterin synthase catalytic subunit